MSSSKQELHTICTRIYGAGGSLVFQTYKSADHPYPTLDKELSGSVDGYWSTVTWPDGQTFESACVWPRKKDAERSASEVALQKLKESHVFGSVFKAYDQAKEANKRLEDEYRAVAKVVGIPGGLGVIQPTDSITEEVTITETSEKENLPERTAAEPRSQSTDVVKQNGQITEQLELEPLKDGAANAAMEDDGEGTKRSVTECAGDGEGEGKVKKRKCSEVEVQES